MECEAPGCSRKSRSRFRDGAYVCGLHYQRLDRNNSFELPPRKKLEWKTCSIDGCENLSRTVGGALCETHYYRRYRTGSTSDPITGRTYITSHGYVGAHKSGHPVAGKNGHAYEHRINLYDAIGGGVHKCNWCGDEVSWDIRKGSGMLVADHLDNDKQNNDPSNLVPSCQPCNATRGLFMSWVFKHKDDPFLLSLFTAANDNNKQPDCKAA